MKRAAVLGIFALGFLLTLAQATVIQVNISNFAFVPDTVNVTAGDTVRWTNNDQTAHTTTSGTGGVWDSLWDSGSLSRGASFSFAFTTAGNRPYFCRPHPWMVGQVIVKASGIEERAVRPEPEGLKASPNPFNASTRFDAVGPVRVHDAAGRLVRTLEGPAVVWDGRDSEGRDVAAGVYHAVVFRTGRAIVVVKSE